MGDDRSAEGTAGPSDDPDDDMPSGESGDTQRETRSDSPPLVEQDDAVHPAGGDGESIGDDTDASIDDEVDHETLTDDVDIDETVEEDPIDTGLIGSGPEYDQEMPLADHIEEMIKRLAIVIVIAGSVTIVTFPLADQVINFLWYSILPGTEVARPRVYGPLEFLLTRLKVASLAGLIVALPVFVYQTYRFMRPGLYRNERRYYLAAVPTSLVLAIIGVLFAYFIVLPAIFTYFLAYSEGAGEIAFALARTFDLILILMAYLAIVFQIPLAIMLAIMMGITTRQWLQDKRLYFWGAFLGISFISSPDPTGMAPIIIALTMVGLFEGTLLVLRWVGR